MEEEDGFEHVCSMSAFSLHLHVIQTLPVSERLLKNMDG